MDYRSNTEYDTFGVFNLAYAAETETAQEEIQGITADEALQIATKNASYEVVKYPKVWEDKNADGIDIYKVVFYVGQVEFGYQIDKADGTILKCEIDD